MTEAVVVGVLVVVLSQYFLKLILEPIINFRRVLSDISHALLSNQEIIGNAGGDDKELTRKIHELSARLRSTVYLVPFYSFWCAIRVFALPKRQDIVEASHELIKLGYGVKPIGTRTQSEQAARNENSLSRLTELLRIDTKYIETEKP